MCEPRLILQYKIEKLPTVGDKQVCYFDSKILNFKVTNNILQRSQLIEK